MKLLPLLLAMFAFSLNVACSSEPVLEPISTPAVVPASLVESAVATPVAELEVREKIKEIIAATIASPTNTEAVATAMAPATKPSAPIAVPRPTGFAEPSPVVVDATFTDISIPKYMDGVWLCANSNAPLVDDLSTQQSEGYRCSVVVVYTDEFAIVQSNGIPNHDYESGLGCCAAEVEYEWRIPLKPGLASSVTYAPERGAVAISVNGVPFFGPEEGPGGDAVALHFEYFVEDRQPIVLGLCGAHSAGPVFHYHFDGNCVHWHPEEEKKEWTDWNVGFLTKDEASPIIGFAFDGYPIYGPYGNDSNNTLKEMTSSYRLKKGRNGYGGIDDWEYVHGLGDLDVCNGITSEVTGLDEPIYHYHASKTSGSGEIGFPYFILCYSGIPETSNINQVVPADNPPPPRMGYTRMPAP
jgi:hypothetical protein